MMDDSMDMPPYWFGAQFVIADQEGAIPMHERDIFLHFCSQECLAEYAAGQEIKERESLVDNSNDNNRGDPGVEEEGNDA